MSVETQTIALATREEETPPSTEGQTSEENKADGKPVSALRRFFNWVVDVLITIAMMVIASLIVAYIFLRLVRSGANATPPNGSLLTEHICTSCAKRFPCREAAKSKNVKDKRSLRVQKKAAVDMFGLPKWEIERIDPCCGRRESGADLHWCSYACYHKLVRTTTTTSPEEEPQNRQPIAA